MRENGRFGLFVEMFEKYVKKAKDFKNVVLYGWSWENGGGTYLEWIFSRYYNVEFDYIVDDYETTYGKKIYRYNLFEYLDSSDTIIFVTVKGKELCLLDYGYEKNRNVIFVNEELGLECIGYYEWEEKTRGLDLMSRETAIDIKSLCQDGSLYAVSRGIGINAVCEYIKENYPMSSILDVGCGKAGAMLLFREYGIGTVDGLEYLEELCQIGRENMKRSGHDCVIYQGDATLFNKWDQYNLFYLYDPFKGDTFRKVIQNIELSYKRNLRDICLVYANPWEHKIVLENGLFQFEEQIDGDWFTRMTNIYVIKK